MYEKHEEFEPPSSTHSKIWRYLSFEKFISMLHTNSLYFSNAADLSDPFEGSLPVRSSNLDFDSRLRVEHPEQFELAKKALRRFRESLPKWTYINCWHMNETESAAMWKLYASVGNGLAIQSTFGRLANCITDKEIVFIGLVKYINYETDIIALGNAITPFLRKRVSFEHERELRAIVPYAPLRSEVIDSSIDNPNKGILVGVDISTLIERVHVCPGSEDWFLDLVSSIVPKLGFELDVRKSDLDGTPLY